MQRSKLGLGLAIFVLATTGPAQTPTVDLDPQRAALCAARRVEHGIPGMSVAVRNADGSIAVAAFGLADVENDVPVTPRTMFRLASISKPITAVIALRLMEQGTLDLDAAVHTLVPQWTRKQDPITCRQLLGHLAGVRHYRGEEFRSNRPYSSVSEALEIFAEDPLLHPPGSRYRYTTYGFNLAGAACVAASGRDFRTLLQEEIVAPADLVTLRFDDHRQIIRHRAQGYQSGLDGELWNSAPVDTSNKVPGGGMIATPADLARFADALLTGRLLRPQSLRLAWTSQRTTDGKRTGYGMGFSVLADPGDEEPHVVTHGGAQPRVSTMLRIDVDRGVACAVFCNLEGRGRVLRELAEQLLAD